MTCRQYVTVSPLAVKKTQTLAGGYSFAAPVSLKVQLTPMDAEAVVKLTGQQLDRPYLLMTDVRNNAAFSSLEELAELFRLANEVEDASGAKYSIANPPEIWEAGISTNHVSVVLQGKQHAVG